MFVVYVLSALTANFLFLKTALIDPGVIPGFQHDTTFVPARAYNIVMGPYS